MLIGAVSGSLYYVNRCFGAEYINKYLENTGISLGNTVNYISVTLRALKTNTILFALVFACAFFKAGVILIPAFIIKEGFVYGFTSSAFVASYGVKGGIIASAMLPGILILIPVLIIFSAVNMAYSVQKIKKEKNFFIHYFLFLLAVFTIFCIASLSEGFLTTIFMRWAFSLVT